MELQIITDRWITSWNYNERSVTNRSFIHSYLSTFTMETAVMNESVTLCLNQLAERNSPAFAAWIGWTKTNQQISANFYRTAKSDLNRLFAWFLLAVMASSKTACSEYFSKIAWIRASYPEFSQHRITTTDRSLFAGHPTPSHWCLPER